MKNETKRMIALLVMAAMIVNVVVWLWVIDFAWWSTAYIYVPFIFWDQPVTDSVAINIAYWMICGSIIAACVASYVLGRSR